MHVQIRAQNPGHQSSYRAGRRFPVGEYVKMEVVKDGDYPADDNGNGPLLEGGKLDMTRINERGWAAIKNDSVHFSVFSDSETSSGISSDVLDGIKRRLTETQQRVTALEIENDGLRAALVKAEGKLASAQAEVGALKAKATEGEAAEAKAEPAKADKPKK